MNGGWIETSSRGGRALEAPGGPDRVHVRVVRTKPAVNHEIIVRLQCQHGSPGTAAQVGSACPHRPFIPRRVGQAAPSVERQENVSTRARRMSLKLDVVNYHAE
jgi:hypothetical protein